MTDFRYHSFAETARRGPSMPVRVTGSAALRRRQRLARLISSSLARVEVRGLDWLPADGGAILAVNHTTFLDGPLIFGLLSRPVSFLVKAEAFQPVRGLAGAVLRDAAQLPVRRHQLDPGPVRYGLRLLEQGGLLGMFPEGTRGKGLVTQVRPGVGYLALRAGVPVLPVAVVGAERMLRQPARTPVLLQFGQPLHFGRVAVPLARRHWLDAAEQVRLALAAQVQDALSRAAGAAARMDA
ncbi:MAG TPA: lysophospholipid acyltransferase family protein [Jatrophihabitans sp.]|nr:lysophospholipid acyltransferase family protein [Jatrophihabitans sp.]